MKIWTLVVCAFFGSATAMAQSAATVQGGASSRSSTSVQASRSGANAAHDGESSAAVASDHGSADLAQGTELNATLVKPVDARRAKPGDEVTVTISEDVKSDGQVVFRRGTRLIGHVTEAKPHEEASGSANGSAASSLGIVFDKAVTRDGRELPFNATIRALAAADSTASAGAGRADAGIAGAGNAAGAARSSGGGLGGSLGGAIGGAASATGDIAGHAGGAIHSGASATGHVLGASTGAIGGLDAAGAFRSGSRGVFGMRGLDIGAASSSAAHGSVITSASRNVRLDGGTRMLLVGSANASRN